MTFQLFRPRFLQGKSKLTGKDDLDNLRDSGQVQSKESKIYNGRMGQKRFQGLHGPDSQQLTSGSTLLSQGGGVGRAE